VIALSPSDASLLVVSLCLTRDACVPCSSVVTQFQRNKITQFFVQNGKKFEMPAATFPGVEGMNAVTPEFCKAQFEIFDDRDRFNELGGFDKMNEALSSEWVLVMSLWDDVSGAGPSIPWSDPPRFR
jgi:hypothetical protein